MMKCVTCKTNMKCEDDVNDINVRIDWEYCPKCNSVAEIHYGNNGEYVTKVIWKRDRD